MTKTNEFVHEVGRRKLEEILLTGEFPEVAFHKERSATGFSCTGYSMMEYTVVNSKFFTVINDRLRNDEFPDGIFTSNRIKRASFTNRVSRIIDAVTADDIRNVKSRLRSWAD